MAQEYGSLLIPIIMPKLPNEIRLEIARKSTTEVWKETIKGEIEAREASEAIKAQSDQSSKLKNFKDEDTPRVRES